MPIETAQWLVPDRVIYAYAWGKVTLDDMTRHNARMTELLEAGTPLVHTILDSAPDTDFENPNLKIGMDNLSFIRREELGFTAQVSNLNPIARSVSVILAKIVRARFRMVDTVEEAIDLLKYYDASVDWTQADYSIIGSPQSLAQPS